MPNTISIGRAKVGYLLARLGGKFTGRLTTNDGVTGGADRIVGGLVSVLQAAGAALTNSASETVLSSMTVKANTIKAGTVMRITFQGIVTANNSTTTLTIRVRIGAVTLTGTVVMATAAVDTNVNDMFVGYIELIGRAAPSATSACVAFSQYNDPGAAGAAAKTQILGSTNFATNGDLLVEVTGQWSAADANSCRLDILNVEVQG